MLSLPILLLAATATVLANGTPDVIQPPLRVNLQVPEEYQRISTRNVITNWVDMPIDHFNNLDSRTYAMRYMYNDEFFGGNDYPIFIFVGGEWSINASWLRAGNMYEQAKEHRGYLFYTEHRYYGRSLPFADFTTENLQYLSIEQALADLAQFIRSLKTQPRFANSKVVLFGGSYAGNMAIWFRKTYPELVAGVVSSSGPIKAEVDFKGYLETVHDAFLQEGGQACVDVMNDGIAATAAALASQDVNQRRALEGAFRLCEPLDYNDSLTLGIFSGLISWTFSGAVQSARPGSIKAVCDLLTTPHFGITPMERIGGYVSNGMPSTNCRVVSYDSYLSSYGNNDASRAWYYQTCTEYGYYQTAPTSGTVFDPLVWLSVPFYVNACQKLFDERFNVAFVNAAADRINQIYGGLNPNVTNTVNVHGVLDPWRRLGVYTEDIADSSPTIDVPRASHCFDLQPWLTTDTIRMVNAKQDVRRIVARWLH